MDTPRNLEPYELFYNELMDYYNDFREELSTKYSKQTVRKYAEVIGYLIDFLCFEKGVAGFEDITISLKNSKFRNSFYPNTDSSTPPKTSERYIDEFFRFIYQEYGVKNDKLKIY